MLIAGFPGGASPISSRSRTNGERASGARAGEGENWPVILNILNSGAPAITVSA